MKFVKLHGVRLGVLSLLLVSAWPTRAALTFNLSHVLSGQAPASSATPWLTATFEQGGSDNVVTLRMEAVNLTGRENVKDWLFNLNPALNPGDLLFTRIQNSSGFNVSAVDVHTQSDGFNQLGFSFDFDVAFPNGSPGDRFTDNEFITFQITRTSSGTLSPSDFNFTSTSSGNGAQHTIAHIRDTPGGSAWVGEVPVPEPSTYLAAALLVLPVLIRLLRRRRSVEAEA